jgi:hypothetical protein
MFKLSFRSATASLEKIREQMRRVLQLPARPTGNPAAKEIENALCTYMRRACEAFDLSRNIEVIPKRSSGDYS